MSHNSSGISREEKAAFNVVHSGGPHSISVCLMYWKRSKNDILTRDTVDQLMWKW